MSNKEIKDLTYDEAVAEIESLLFELEGNQLPVNKVLEKSRRVVALIGFCKREISKVGTEVDDILKELRQDTQTSASDSQ